MEALKSLRGTNGPDEIVFEHFPRIERLRRDLKLAGIASVDAMGRHADFHSLRKTVGTNLAKAGEPRRAVMDFMRLSDGKLADDIYTDVNQLDTGAVVDVLPDYTISPSQGASQELVAASQNGSSGGTMGDGAKADKSPENIVESHIVALHVTSGHNMETGGSGGARTRHKSNKNKGQTPAPSQGDSQRFVPTGRDLAQVVTAWPKLAAPLKAAILAIINSLEGAR